MEVAFPWDPLQYPFEVPGHSFLWSAGRVDPLPGSVTMNEVSAGRHPVLAIGSNASPAQLTRKFGDRRFTDPASPEGSIPVLAATVEGVDVVYGAHVAPYGSLPATLLDTPGTCAQVFITWVTKLQWQRLNETEGLGHAYQLRPIEAVRCHGHDVGAALAYVTMGGACVLGGSPLGLASIHASGSPWPRGTQRRAWDLLSADMGGDGDGDGGALLQEVLGSSGWRERVESHLAATSVPETYEALEL